MTTFEDFWAKQHILESDANLFFKMIVEQAYRAGWDACRDKWGGMTYDETGASDGYGL